MSTRFPTLTYVGAAVAAATVGKPWLSRQWRRAVDVLLVVLCVTMALAGSAGVPELLLAAAAGGLAGTAVLVALGAPNRRPTPATIRDGLVGAGLAVQRLDVERAVGGRAQLYRVATGGRGGVRQGVQPGQSRRRPALPLVPHRRAQGAGCSRRRRWRATWSTRRCCCCSPSVAASLARRCVPSSPCPMARRCWRWRTSADADWTRWRPTTSTPRCSMRCGGRSTALHRCGVSHGALRAANVLVTDAGQVRLIDLGAGSTAADPEGPVDRPGRAARFTGIRRRSGVRGRVRGACPHGRRSGRSDAVPAAARPVRGDPPCGPEVDAQGPPQHGRRDDDPRSGAAGAAGQGSTPHRRHDRHPDRGLLHPAAATGERRRQRLGPGIGELVVARRRRGDVGVHLPRRGGRHDRRGAPSRCRSCRRCRSRWPPRSSTA